MSELKAINAYRLTTNTEDCDMYIHNDEFDCGGDLVECYLKSEADKVIAEKDKRIDLYKRGFEENDKINAHLYAELRHSNYKRCLGMAGRCRLRARVLSVRGLYEKEQWVLKWHKRWLELAEKFEEAK